MTVAWHRVQSGAPVAIADDAVTADDSELGPYMAARVEDTHFGGDITAARTS